MTSQEWNSYSDREKMLYRKGYFTALCEMNAKGKISESEKDVQKFSFDTYLKLLETIK